ncbi:MAG: class I SAM-dependent methyltransferase [Candidatus Goldbacteria bacterium]|nr:class I SAM-dependent methyltransferase [Candidatus Goldiibacteriota bacterium]
MQFNTPYNVLRYKDRVFARVSPFFYGDSLLDCGCGNGEDVRIYTRYFKRIHGMDIDESPDWKLYSNEFISFSKGDAQKLDFENKSFDTVMEKDMLHHVRSPADALKEMIRVSKKRIIIIEANRYNPLLYVNMTLIRNHQHFTQKYFKNLIISTGLSHEFHFFAARCCPLKGKVFNDFYDLIHNVLEKIPFYRPIIEYNMAILTK